MKKYYDYEFNLLGVDEVQNFAKSRLRFWYDDIKKNALKKDGDMFEFGVYRGNSLVTAALILKKMKSKKKKLGFNLLKEFLKNLNLII